MSRRQFNNKLLRMVFEYFGTNGLRSYIRDAIDQVLM